MFLLKYHVIFVLLVITCIILIVSCQRELSVEAMPPSEGEFVKDSNDNCSVIVVGTYIKQKKFDDSDYIEATVNVATPGSYNITSDTINGYHFKATGVFSNKGILKIKLAASGNPVTADTDHFTLYYNHSVCEADIIVIDTTAKPASFTLAGAPGNCMDDTVFGSYINIIALDTNAKVKIKVNVLVAGRYTITSNTLNGFGFSGSGNFLNTGIQQVFLYATGTPLNEETDIFSFDAGSSQCKFLVNVLTPQQVSGSDYFPLSKNSFWIYDDLINIGEGVAETVIDSTDINNSEYKTVKEDVHFGGPYKYFYRKSGNDYFEYAAPNKYTSFFQYKKPVYADIPFLKENIATGFAWQSPEYIDTTTNGNIIKLKYNFSCVDNNASITLNGKAFVNVYKISMQPLVDTAGNNYNYTTEKYIFYYAKGIGLIYIKKTLAEFIQREWQIRKWQVY